MHVASLLQWSFISFSLPLATIVFGILITFFRTSVTHFPVFPLSSLTILISFYRPLCVASLWQANPGRRILLLFSRNTTHTHIHRLNARIKVRYVQVVVSMLRKNRCHVRFSISAKFEVLMATSTKESSSVTKCAEMQQQKTQLIMTVSSWVSSPPAAQAPLETVVIILQPCA